MELLKKLSLTPIDQFSFPKFLRVNLVATIPSRLPYIITATVCTSVVNKIWFGPLTTKIRTSGVKPFGKTISPCERWNKLMVDPRFISNTENKVITNKKKMCNLNKIIENIGC